MAMNKQRRFIIIAAAVGVISVFLPWATVGGTSISNGFAGGGVVVFLSFAALVAIAFLGDQAKPLPTNMWLLALGLGVLALLLSVVKFSQISGSAFGLVSTGFGLYITLVGAVAALLTTWLFKSPGDNLQTGFDSFKKNMGNMSGPTHTPPPPSAPTTSRVDELEKLIRMRNEGKITEEEYNQMKSKLV